jgi:ureidoglycolate hydrolase
MSRIVSIPVEPLTEEAFQPFGELLSIKDRPADFQGVSSTGWKAGFEATASPAIMLLSSRYVGMQFNLLERHFNVTQTFIPLGGTPSVVAVAGPTTKDEIPQPESLRAFLIDGSAGYVLHKGTWHSLDRYPLGPPSAEIVIITSQDTQQELETVDQASWKLTQQVDYEAEYGVTFEIIP